MEFHKLGIIGGCSMGKSIAHKVASSGIDVVVLEGEGTGDPHQ